MQTSTLTSTEEPAMTLRRQSMKNDAGQAYRANRRAERYGVLGRITAADVRVVMALGHCFYCGTTEHLGLDHVKPLHAGGENARRNLVACCVPCNASKFRGEKPGLCRLGHEISGENVQPDYSSGRRRCKTCFRAWRRADYRRKQGAA